MILYYLYAFLIGALVILSPIINGQNAAKLGTLRGSFYNYLFASLAAVLLALYFSNDVSANGFSEGLSQLSQVPLTHFLGGFIGCAVILIMNAFTVKIKAFYIVILPFLGQLLMGLAIDQVVGKDFTLKQLMGLCIILVGLFLSTRKRVTKITENSFKEGI